MSIEWVHVSFSLYWGCNYRIFVGNLSKEVTEKILVHHFAIFKSIVCAVVVKEKNNRISKGFGYVDFYKTRDFYIALIHLNGSYIVNRPCKLRRVRSVKY